MWLVGVVSRRWVLLVGEGGIMGVVSRRWMWVESMGVVSRCGCKAVYRFPHITYPYSSCICSFLQLYPYFLFIFIMFFFLVPVLFCNKILCTI